MRFPANLLAPTLIAALLASCAPSNPQARIEQDPSRYNRLSSKEKSLVDQGLITTGMSADAVYLAWGRPSAVSKGEDGKGRIERWTYTGTTPVWSNQFNVGYGGGLRRYPYRDFYGFGYGGFYDYGPTVTYVPYTTGVVHFRDGRVSKWEDGGR